MKIYKQKMKKNFVKKFFLFFGFSWKIGMNEYVIVP